MRYLKSHLAVLVIGAAFTSSAALATPVTHSLDVSVDTSIEFEDVGVIPIWSADLYPEDTFSSGLPFTLGEGDTVDIDVTTTGPGFNLVDSGAGGGGAIATALQVILGAPWDQGADNPTFDTVLTYDQTTTVTVTAFTGDFKDLDPFTFSFSRAETSPFFRMLGFGDYTDTSVNIQSFNITTTFTNIAYQPGYEAWAALNTRSDDNIAFFTLDDYSPTVIPNPVPAPGALALLGFGLLGLRMRRRTA